MIFRTEFLSAGALGAPLSIFVKAIAALAARLRPATRREAELLTLSDYALRDAGLERFGPGEPILFDLMDLGPRGAFFGHRRLR